MNVGLFSDCYRPTTSGVVTSIVQLKEGLEQRGHKVILVTVDAPSCCEKERTVYRFPSVAFNSASGFRLGLVNHRIMRRIIQDEQLELVHTHTEFSVGWAAKRAARVMNLPLVHTAHTMYEYYRHYLFFGALLSPRLIRGYLRLFLCGYDVLVCPSLKAQNYFSSCVPDARTTVIGNGVHRARFRSDIPATRERDQIRRALGIQPTDKVVIYVGRLGKEKRVGELLDVLTPLLTKGPEYKALFVGCGPASQAMSRAVARGHLRHQVIFTGAVRWEEMHRLYSMADVFVTASLSEVQPMTLIEASMCGLPIVARREDAYLDLVQDGYNGFLADSDREMAERLSEILENKAKLLEFSRNGRTLSARFEAETHVERMESLYRQIMKEYGIGCSFAPVR